MSILKKGLVAICLLINFNSIAQVGFGLQGGFQQSIPLVLRDSFSGKPALGGALNFYIPAGNKLNLAIGLSYKEVALSHKTEATSLNWQTLGLNLGNEWYNSNFVNTTFYTGINASYIMTFGKTALSGTTSSGTGFYALEIKQKFVPGLELGITFKPKPFINFKISTIQPIPQTSIEKKPTLPGTLNFGLEYRITNRDINNWSKDTTRQPEYIFTANLKSGTLFFIEDGTVVSQRVFRNAINQNYSYSKVEYINGNNLKQILDSFAHSPDSSQIFIVKTGTIIYNSQRASTLGLIVYNYKMENPLPESAFFVRTLADDTYLEDSLVVKKLIKTLNKRLYKTYNMYRQF